MVAAVLLLLTLVAAACGGDGAGDAAGDDAGEPTSAGTGGGTEGEPSVVRFAFERDAIMDYLVETGTLEEMQEEWNVELELNETFDEFAFFAGGHGDVVSTASHEVAMLEDETDIDTVTFGKYNYNHTHILVRTDSEYQTLEDLVGEKVVVGSSGSMWTWGAFAKEQYDLDFTFEGGDYEVILNDHAANPEFLARGEAEACLCPTELAAPQHAAGEVRPLYDNQTISEIWETETGHRGIMQNVFTATAEWYESHPHEVEFFLALWEEGIRLWHENKEDIIRAGPEHFNVEAEEDIDWLVGYLQEHDWNVDTVYLDEEWVEGELEFFELLKETEFIDPELEAPRYEIVSP